MKIKILFLVLALVLLNSCIVKSLHPFYTTDTVFFQKQFLGEWQGDEKGFWEVKSFGNFFLNDKGKIKSSELKQEDLKIYNRYEDGYLVKRTEKGHESVFLAMSFKINNELFIDFTPLEVGSGIDELILMDMHLIPTHSLAKFDIESVNTARIRWFEQDKIEELFNQNKIKIEHEKVGIDETFLLTASSEELQKFIKKYMASNYDEKWETSVDFTLQKIKK